MVVHGDRYMGDFTITSAFSKLLLSIRIIRVETEIKKQIYMEFKKCWDG